MADPSYPSQQGRGPTPHLACKGVRECLHAWESLRPVCHTTAATYSIALRPHFAITMASQITPSPHCPPPCEPGRAAYQHVTRPRAIRNAYRRGAKGPPRPLHPRSPPWSSTSTPLTPLQSASPCATRSATTSDSLAALPSPEVSTSAYSKPPPGVRGPMAPGFSSSSPPQASPSTSPHTRQMGPPSNCAASPAQ